MTQQEKKTTRINKMVMQGFKSFAKHTEVLFGPKFNCVLGPNGAGKSNVLDSLCFVLGKSGSKNLRAEKSGNLVYNGGKSKKPAKHGEVSIFFDNKLRMFPYEQDEVKVSRIVKQSGQSVYRINDETKTRREILELLGLAKINPDGYNIILQGDIVRFVEMPPIERRGLIEDIAGISVYEEKKNKALNELDKVEKHLNDTEIILKERETHLKELRKDRDQAMKYKEMNDKVRENKASYLKLQMDRKEKEQKDMDGKAGNTQDSFTKLQDDIKEFINKSLEKEQEMNAISKEIEEKGEVEQVSLNKEVENLKIDLAKAQSRTETVNQEITKVQNRRKDLASNLEESKRKIDQLDQDQKEAKSSFKGKEKDLQEVVQKIKDFKDKNKLDDIGNIESKIEEIDKKSEELLKDVHDLREKKHSLIREQDDVQREISLIDERIQKVSEVEKEHKEQLDEIQGKRQEFKKSTLELNKCLDEDSTLATTLNKLRNQRHELSEDLSKLRARNISIQETTRGDVAIKSILGLQSKREGIYGTVADLGNVSSKYGLALEVAAGQRIKSIVVETESVASECIKYLKTKRLGTATFLPLNKVRSKEQDKQLQKLAKGSGCHGFAIDLVEHDPKFKKVFSHVFENTLVVDNIDVAVRLGIGKAKFVTLDGDLAARSGAMHGGFRQRKKESMGFKEKELTKDLEKAEKLMAELEESITVHEQKKQENEEKITSLRQFKAELEGAIIKGEKSLHLEDNDLSASHGKKKELQDREQLIITQEGEITTTISEKNQELAQFKVEKQKLRAAITQLNNPALIAELSAFEQKKNELKDEIIRMEQDIKNREHLTSNITKPEYNKIEDVINLCNKEEKDFKTELVQLQESVKTKENQLSEKEKLLADFRKRFKGLFAKSNQLKDEVHQITLKIEKKKEESRQLEIKLNTYSLKKSELTGNLTSLQEEFAQYEGVPLNLERSEEDLKKEIAKWEKMRENIGAVNMRALDIYDTVEKQYKELTEKKDGLANEREDVIMLMNEIEGKKKELFLQTFDAVNAHFQEFFKMLTTKGAEAALIIEDPENPFEAGVRINVKISGSKFLDIRSLSGGEKTLTALAFIFAIQEHDPASFYVLDEVDAALDKHNSERLAKLLKKYATNAQYILISHNDGIISTADNLYGVSMNEHGISQVVSLKV